MSQTPTGFRALIFFAKYPAKGCRLASRRKLLLYTQALQFVIVENVRFPSMNVIRPISKPERGPAGSSFLSTHAWQSNTHAGTECCQTTAKNRELYKAAKRG